MGRSSLPSKPWPLGGLFDRESNRLSTAIKAFGEDGGDALPGCQVTRDPIDGTAEVSGGPFAGRHKWAANR